MISAWDRCSRCEDATKSHQFGGLCDIQYSNASSASGMCLSRTPSKQNPLSLASHLHHPSHNLAHNVANGSSISNSARKRRRRLISHVQPQLHQESASGIKKARALSFDVCPSPVKPAPCASSASRMARVIEYAGKLLSNRRLRAELLDFAQAQNVERSDNFCPLLLQMAAPRGWSIAMPL